MKILKRLFLGVCLCSMFACSSDNDDVVQPAGYLTNTTWTYEQEAANSSSVYSKSWGKLQFASATQVIVTSGYEDKAVEEHSQGGRGEARKREWTRTGEYNYSKPVLKITLPAREDDPVTYMTFTVDETNGTITRTDGGGNQAAGSAVVYRRK